MHYINHFNCLNCGTTWEGVQPIIQKSAACPDCRRHAEATKSVKYDVVETIHHGPISVTVWNPEKTGGAETLAELEAYEAECGGSMSSGMRFANEQDLHLALTAIYNETDAQLNYHIE